MAKKPVVKFFIQKKKKITLTTDASEHSIYYDKKDIQ